MTLCLAEELHLVAEVAVAVVGWLVSSASAKP